MNATSSTEKTLHLFIRGRVQGVFFRDSMRHEAQSLGVAGWVRNCGDGSVEAMVQGTAQAVDAVVRWAHHGPPQARVEQVVTEAGTGTYSTFEILR